jgi:iron complex transport system substrate-binding protein
MCSGTPRSERAAGRGIVLILILLIAAGALVSAEPPRRICSVSLAGDELLALLVPRERVVCVSSLVDDPVMSNAAGHFPESVPRLGARIEPVLAQRPDLVVAAPWNRGGFLELLERSSVRALVLEPVVDFEDIRREVLRVGQATGAGERAARIVSRLDARLAALDRRLTGLGHRPRVLSFSHMIVAGEGTTVDTLIRRAGGRNAAREAELQGHAKVSMEQLLTLDPDVLLLGFDSEGSPERLFEAYPHLSALRAVRADRVIVLPPRKLTTVTPHLVEGVEALARALHPERMPAAEGKESP